MRFFACASVGIWLWLGGSFAAHAQWQRQNAGFLINQARLSDISIVNANVVFVTTASYDAFSRTNNGGATWTLGQVGAGPPGAPGSSWVYGSISAVDANNVWVGNYRTNRAVGSVPGGGYVYYSRNGGATWTYQSTAAFAGSGSFLNNIHLFDLRNGVVAGDPAGGSFEVYSTADGGALWNRVPAANLPPPLVGEEGYVGVLTAVGNAVWFGTNFGRVYFSTNRGLSWQVGDALLPEVRQLAFSDALNGLALYNDAGTGTVTLSRTRDGGLSWSAFSPTAGPVYASGLAQVPGRAGTFVSTGLGTATGGSSYTTDYGLTWQAIDQGTPRGPVAFYDAQTGWAGGIGSSTTGTTYVGGIYRSAATLLPTRAGAGPLAGPWAYPTPVPAGGTLTVALPTTARVQELRLLNGLGQVVLAWSLAPAAAPGSSLSLPLPNLAPGVYTLLATSAATTLTQRVVVE